VASAEREPIWGLEALPPVGSRGKAFGQGVRGASPPEANDILILGYKFSELRMHL
jgi:hypothetical protein